MDSNYFANLCPEKIPVVCLMGPTATGKTDAAAQCFDAFPCDISSDGSSLVSRDMDIGTAKPDTEFLKKYPHHLVDVRHPNDTYSVADFFHDCTSTIAEISNKGKVPVLAGGTMFYFSALEKGLNELPQADPALRARLDEDAKKYGWQKLHSKLSDLDPENAKRIDPNDAQRFQRALEIVMLSGKTLAQHNESGRTPLSNPLIKMALTFSDRSVLHKRIEKRFDIMLDKGLEREVSSLLSNGVDPDATSMRMIGYRQMLEYLAEKSTYDQMRLKGIAATRQLAKRQLTWLRNQSNQIWWIDEGLESVNFQSLTRFVENYFH